MPIDTAEAILEDIIASPDDDMPRLVLADYFEENGQSERAEFIRTQIALAKMSEWSYTYGKHRGCSHDNRCRDCLLKIREGELFNSWVATGDISEEFGDPGCPFSSGWHVKDCLTGTYKIQETQYGPAKISFHWKRGFVEQIFGPMKFWEKYGPEFVKLHPLTFVGITNREPAHSTDGWHYWEEDTMDKLYVVGQRLIPVQILLLLDKYAQASRRSVHFASEQRMYETRETAIQALSRACIAWAKSQPPKGA